MLAGTAQVSGTASCWCQTDSRSGRWASQFGGRGPGCTEHGNSDVTFRSIRSPGIMASFQATMPLSPGTRLGHYDVTALIHKVGRS